MASQQRRFPYRGLEEHRLQKKKHNRPLCFNFFSYVRLFRACLGKMIVLIFENNWNTKGHFPRQAYRCGKVTSQCFFDLKSQQAARWKLCEGGRRLPWLAQLEQQLVA